LVFGARAGKAAAAFAAEQRDPGKQVLEQAMDENRRLEEQYLHKSGGRERVATLREEMQKTMEAGAGIYRAAGSLTEAQRSLQKIRERTANVMLDDHSLTFNTELIAALEQSFLLDVAEAMVHSALHRTESRGAHQRTDFPDRDDQQFLAHTLVSRNPDGGPRVSHLPVTITRWPPGKRVYGQAAQQTQGR